MALVPQEQARALNNRLVTPTTVRRNSGIASRGSWNGPNPGIGKVWRLAKSFNAPHDFLLFLLATVHGKPDAHAGTAGVFFAQSLQRPFSYEWSVRCLETAHAVIKVRIDR